MTRKVRIVIHRSQIFDVTSDIVSTVVLFLVVEIIIEKLFQVPYYPPKTCLRFIDFICRGKYRVENATLLDSRLNRAYVPAVHSTYTLNVIFYFNKMLLNNHGYGSVMKIDLQCCIHSQNIFKLENNRFPLPLYNK